MVFITMNLNFFNHFCRTPMVRKYGLTKSISPMLSIFAFSLRVRVREFVLCLRLF